MIHPQYWSLASIWDRLHRQKGEILTLEDKRCYSTLDVKDKVVLDVGASNGDSARFFLKRGAKKVICIEIDPELAKYIKDPRCEVIVEPFKLEHLKLPHDCMKMDIEGWEEDLLAFEASELKPSILEVHGLQLMAKFEKKGWRYLTRCSLRNCISFMVNYDWKGK